MTIATPTLFRTARQASASLLAALLLCAASATAAAQTVDPLLPVSVQASGNHAEIAIGGSLDLADVTLDFEDASGLSPSSLGVTARLVSLTDAALLSRLPDTNLTSIPGALPLLITIEPPAAGGLTFRNTGRMEIHTHALPYSVGSFFRVFKSPLGGAFRDVTDEIAQGSVRARTTYGGFSEFLILVDLRPTGQVIDEKIGWLRARVATLPTTEQAGFGALLDDTESAIAAADYDAALADIAAFQARARARAGQGLANEWRATRDADNQTGELVAGARTLQFSVAYLRDFGQ